MAGGAATIGEASAASDISAAHARLIADKSTQFDLPVFSPPKTPEWLKPVLEFIAQIFPAFPYFFWGAVALGACLILWGIFANADGMGIAWPWRRKATAKTAERAWQPDAAAARALLSEAEALARDGRYAEAARLLLHHSVEDIAKRRPEFLKPSLTARDIAAAPAIPHAARGAFGAIARVVEISTFGSAALTAQAWDDCRTAYGTFALAGAWNG